MSSTTIHYINANHKRFDDSLVRQSDLDDDRFVYSQCPVYNHRSNRVFVGTSPIDFKLKITSIYKKTSPILEIMLSQLV